jgi:signal transduction histidine kinase
MRDHLIPRAGSVALCAAAVAACATTGALTVSGSSSENAASEAAARMLTVAVPIAVGFFALHRPPFERFGALLVLAGFAWFTTTLATAGDPVLYSLGRLAYWAFEPLLIFLLLAFPTGRLEHRLDRGLVSAAVLLVVVLYLPTALLVERYPVPVPATSCGADCPTNAFMVAGSEPGFVEDVVRPLRELLTIALFAVVAGRVAQRLHSASRLTRRALAPVLAVACFRFAAFAGVLVGRRTAPESQVVDASVWVLTLAVPITAVAFLVGVARWWVFIAQSTRRLAATLHAHSTPDDLRRCLAEAFDDPALEIVYWIGNGEGHWGDAEGRAVERLPVPAGRTVTEISDHGHRVAAIIHDAALGDDRAFIDTATSYALMTLENHRLSAQTASLLRAVRESRSRIQAAADEERRRIERDLHDGAQQRLVALRIKLELAAERTGNGAGHGAEAAAALRRLGSDVEEALEEVRSLARGIYPASLADHGLVEGLRAAALRNVLPTTVFATGVGRHAPEIESAAYFCCLEALQNAAKHADGASVAVVEVSEGDVLRMEVRDDGAGFDPAAVVGGVGFTSMHDRLAAVSGELEITSSPGRGTRVTAIIPLNGNDVQTPRGR